MQRPSGCAVGQQSDPCRIAGPRGSHSTQSHCSQDFGDPGGQSSHHGMITKMGRGDGVANATRAHDVPRCRVYRGAVSPSAEYWPLSTGRIRVVESTLNEEGCGSTAGSRTQREDPPRDRLCPHKSRKPRRERLTAPDREAPGLVGASRQPPAASVAVGGGGCHRPTPGGRGCRRRGWDRPRGTLTSRRRGARGGWGPAQRVGLRRRSRRWSAPGSPRHRAVDVGVHEQLSRHLHHRGQQVASSVGLQVLAHELARAHRVGDFHRIFSFAFLVGT